jgi:prepilin-type N-terminal cleavage/methylation domain-containing protein
LKNKINTNTNINKGFTLVEAVVGMAIIAFVMVGILSTFSHQQMVSRKYTEKNTAVILAEMKLEELLKFSSEQLKFEVPPFKGNVVDYITFDKGKFEFFDVDPNEPTQFRRTYRVISGPPKDPAFTIRVRVEYGRTKTGVTSGFTYPFQITLVTRRF